MADNTLTLKFDEKSAMAIAEKVGKEIVLPIVEVAGKSAYAIAVAHGFKGSEQDWLDSLKGPKGDPGDKGDPFKFSDFTQEQLNALKGKKGDTGDPGSAELAAELLKNKNVYLPDASVDTVLAKLVELLGNAINVTYKQLEYVQPLVGQTYLDLKGEPHFKVSVNGGEKIAFVSDNLRVNIDAFGETDILVKYFDLADRVVGNIAIRGVIVGETPDEEYRENGITYKLFGTTLKVNITGNTVNGNFNDNPKNWNVTQKTIYATKPTTLNLGDNWNTYGPYFVETPKNVTFKGYNNNMKLTVATLTQGTKTLAFNKHTIEWNEANSSYINTGYENSEHL